jgi:hypothetical protein
MHTFTPNAAQAERGYLICLRAERDPREKRCAGFEQVYEKVSRVEVGAGAWGATLFNSVAGIRKRPSASPRKRSFRTASGDEDYKDGLGSYGALMRRSTGGKWQQERMPSPWLDDGDDWEAWVMSSTGELVTYPLSSSGNSYSTSSLLVTKAGPACPVGKKSVAIGFGGSIKLVLLGTELYDDIGDDDVPQLALGRRPQTLKGVRNARFADDIQ